MKILVRPNTCVGMEFESTREREIFTMALLFNNPNPPSAARFNPYYDGKVSFWLDVSKQVFPSGFFEHVLNHLLNYGINPTVEIVKMPLHVDVTIDPEVCNGMRLRDYQMAAVETAIKKKRGLVTAPPRSGKTLIQAAVAKTLNLKSVIFVQRESLLRQHYENMQKWGMDPGIIQGSQRDFHKQHCIAMLQTVNSSLSNPDMRKWLDSIEVMQTDECFPEGTMIGNHTIESLKVGDIVDSFNHTSDRLERRKVVRTFKNPMPSSMVRVSVNGSDIIATPEHPFYSVSRRAYVPAKHLLSGELLLVSNTRQSLHSLRKDLHTQTSKPLQPVLSRVPDEEQNTKEKDRNYLLPGMSNSSPVLRKEQIGVGKEGSFLLFERMQEKRSSEITFDNYGSDQQEICSNKNEEEKSYAQSGNGCQNGESEAQKPHIFKQGRKRETNKTASSSCSPYRTIRDGARNPNSTSNRKIYITAESLQGRHCHSRCEAGSRSGWEDTQNQEVEILRSTKDGSFDIARVDSVEILERGGGSGCEESSKHCYVYNIEVEGNNNYFANGVLVHNCHHSSADTYYRTALECQASWRLGYSGTPFQMVDGLGENRFVEDNWRLYGLYGPQIVNVSLQNLQDLGLLVPVHVVQVRHKHPDMSEVSGEDWHKVYTQGVVNNDSRNNTIAYLASQLVAKGYLPLVLVKQISHGEDLCDRIKQHGAVPMFAKGGKNILRYLNSGKSWISGNIGDAYKMMLEGVANVLVATQIGDEGVDLPHVDALVLAVGGKADQVTTQRIFRPLTSTGTKSKAIVFDFDDRQHGVLQKHSALRRRIYRLLGFEPSMKELDAAIAEIPQRN